jgi:hypothetical protein
MIWRSKPLVLLGFDELPKGDREVLELSSNVIRSLFDELANTFVEPYREMQPALAEQGYQMLWAVMKAASNMGACTHGSIARKIAADVFDAAKSSGTAPARGSRKAKDKYANAMLAEAVAEAVGNGKDPPPRSAAYIKSIEPAVRAKLKRANPPIEKPPDWPGISTMKEEVRKIAEQRKGQRG